MNMKIVFLTVSVTVLASNIARAQEELVYVAVEPCRVADTRSSSEGFITANTNRNFKVAGSAGALADQGGQVDCLNPRSQKPVAVAAYILAVPSNGGSNSKGVLSAYPSDLPPPPVGSGSTVNFGAGQTIGNTTIVTVCASNGCPAAGELSILARNSDQDVVVDVQGYFYPAAKAAYAWADEPGSASYTPDPLYWFNPSGGDVTINRSGAGNYVVTFADLRASQVGGALGNVQVTLYDGVGICNSDGWDENGSDTLIAVRCYDMGGVPSDQKFSVLFTY